MKTKPKNFDSFLESIMKGNNENGPALSQSHEEELYFLNKIIQKSNSVKNKTNNIIHLKKQFSLSEIMPIAAGIFFIILLAFIVLYFSRNNQNLTDYSINIVAHSGEVIFSSETNLKAGASVDVKQGFAGLSLGNDSYLVMDEHTIINIEKTDNTVQSINFLKGYIAVSVNKKFYGNNKKLIIKTQQGNIIVKGTTFSVRNESDAINIALVKGKVQINPSIGNSLYLNENKKISLLNMSETKIEKAEIQRIENLLHKVDNSIETESTLLSDKINEELTGKIFEDRPLNIIKQNNTKNTTNSDQFNENINENYNKNQVNKIFLEAQRYKTLKMWRQAENIYSEIITKFPESEEGLVSLVSCGQIQLDHLHNPSFALINFNSYLKKRPNGNLVQEALYGKALSLRKLNRVNEEIQTIKEMMSIFPSGLYYKELENRLQEITPPQ